MTVPAKGPPIPIPPYKGTRYDPPWAWLFAKGYHGPPDDRINDWYPSLTYEQTRAWLPHKLPKDYYLRPAYVQKQTSCC